MSTSAKTLRFDDDKMWVDLSDGRTLGIPLAWFPRLLRATPDQRKRYEITGSGLHWKNWTRIFPSLVCLLAGAIRPTRILLWIDRAT